ncbi:hypothetical protein [Kribbella sp. VKM Ac-2568]|uniref:hypothetical protein n=1 Tax=Kribbella sp. VKM Ac-2568 TaxID=2512219 RepID=UPI00130540A1
MLSPQSTWKVGYAPETWTALVDHLRSEGFAYSTMVRAGLMTWTEDGDPVDRYRDQLILIARNDRLSPVGFIGIRPDGKAQFRQAADRGRAATSRLSRLVPTSSSGLRGSRSMECLRPYGS